MLRSSTTRCFILESIASISQIGKGRPVVEGEDGCHHQCQPAPFSLTPTDCWPHMCLLCCVMLVCKAICEAKVFATHRAPTWHVFVSCSGSLVHMCCSAWSVVCCCGCHLRVFSPSTCAKAVYTGTAGPFGPAGPVLCCPASWRTSIPTSCWTWTLPSG